MKKEIRNIEKAFNIKLEKYDYKKEQENVYESYRNEYITKLSLQNIAIEDINSLQLVSGRLYSLSLSNCSIGNICGLMNFKNLRTLKLDNVTVNNIDDIIGNPNCTPYEGRLRDVWLTHTTVEDLRVLLPVSIALEYLHIAHCHIGHFYELNLFPQLKTLSLNKVTISQTRDNLPITVSSNKLTNLQLKNMAIDDLDFFQPISTNLINLSLKACCIGNIHALCQCSKLETLTIDSATTVKDCNLPTQPTNASFVLKECDIDCSEAPFDLQKLTAIAPYIKSINFDHYNVLHTECLKHFTQTKELSFRESVMPPHDFLPIAGQITHLSLKESGIKKSAGLQYFTQLQHLYIDNDNPEKGLRSFKKLLPLKDWLKSFRLWEDDIQDLELIRHFSALKSLYFASSVSTTVAEQVFSLDSLKKLYINIDSEKEHSFDLKGLPHIEVLLLNGDIDYPLSFSGLEGLHCLEWLELAYGCKAEGLHHLTKLSHLSIGNATDVNQIPTIKTLKILELNVSKDYEILGLEQFPNLERLRIDQTNKIRLGKLDKLRVLDISDFNGENIDFLGQVPNLEKLNLSYHTLSAVTGLDKLPKLQTLDLSGVCLQNLDGLSQLKNLRFLNLYGNEIADIQVLNQLTSLEEVNLADNNLNEEEIRLQLNKPEIAIFCYLPVVPFFIWDTVHFE